jgi:hypothetical protein
MEVKNSKIIITILLLIIAYLIFKEKQCPEGTKWCQKCNKCMVLTCADKAENENKN